MTNHIKEKCKHGRIVKQCRCPGGEWKIVPCVCPENVISSTPGPPVEKQTGPFWTEAPSKSVHDGVMHMIIRVIHNGVDRNVTIGINEYDFLNEPGIASVGVVARVGRMMEED